MKILCVIPSRIGSTRLPRKALLSIQGKPMVQRVYENAKRCSIINKVIVATDSDEIAAVIKNCGGDVEMTDPNLPTGSDRVAAVAKKYSDMEIIINLQGDEPFIQPTMLEQLVSPYLNNDSPEMTTLAYKLDMEKEYNNPDFVKVITNIKGDAIYFSRSPIPYFTKGIQNNMPVFHHMGIYAFRRDFLLKYTTLSRTPLENVESLEQLRALENGYRIHVCITANRTLEINNPEDLAKAQDFSSKD